MIAREIIGHLKRALAEEQVSDEESSILSDEDDGNSCRSNNLDHNFEACMREIPTEILLPGKNYFNGGSNARTGKLQRMITNVQVPIRMRGQVAKSPRNDAPQDLKAAFYSRKRRFDQNFHQTLDDFSSNMDFLEFQQLKIDKLVRENDKVNHSVVRGVEHMTDNLVGVSKDMEAISALLKTIKGKQMEEAKKKYNL